MRVLPSLAALLLLVAPAAAQAPAVESYDAELLEAVRRGDAEAVARLLEAGADPHARPSPDRTLLLEAAGKGHLEVFRLLREAGVGLAGPPDWGDRSTLAGVCTRWPHAAALEMARGLVELGVEVDHADYAQSPLHNAAVAGNVALVDYLLAAGADPDARDYADTPLHAVIVSGRGAPTERGAIVERLLAAGADPNALTDTRPHRRPLDLAAARGEREVVRLLVAGGGRRSPPPATGRASWGAAGPVAAAAGLVALLALLWRRRSRARPG